jgi:hypothetical protein
MDDKQEAKRKTRGSSNEINEDDIDDKNISAQKLLE